MSSPRVLASRFLRLVRQPAFIAVTVWGNGCIIGGAFLFRWIEHDANPAAASILNCLLWAMGIVTTIGFGEMPVITDAGKVLTILMMMGGALFLWTYMALFVGALIEPEMERIQIDMTQLRKGVHRDLEGDEQQLAALAAQITVLQETLLRRLNEKP